MPFTSVTRNLPGTATYSDFNEPGRTYTEAANSEEETITRSWTNTPGYKGRAPKLYKGKGVKRYSRPKNLVTNNYSYRKYNLKAYSGSFTFYPTDHPEQSHSNSGNPMGPVTGRGVDLSQYTMLPVPSNNDGFAEISDAIDDTSRKLLEKLKNLTIDLGAFYGERKQTTQMFEDLVKKVVNVSKKAAKRDYIGALAEVGLATGKKVRPNSRGIANFHLQLQYGLIPLVSDMHDAVERLHEKRLKGTRDGKLISATRRDGYTKTSFRKAGLGDSISVVDEAVARWSVRQSIRYAINYNSATGPLTEWGITNPSTWIWELTPWSFVVDWFINVGEYLHSLDATNGLIFLRGTLSWKFKETITRIGLGNAGSGSPGSWTSVGAGKGVRTYVACERKPLTGFPSPPLPKFKNPFSPQHVANGLALMRQGLTSPWRR